MSDSVIEAVLRHYGAVRVPTGVGWRSMKCVFHEDRSASASVSTGKEAYNCHACEAKGNPVTLIMWKEGVDYDSAQRLLQEIAGTSYGAVRGEPARKPRKPLSGEARAYEGDASQISFGIRRKPSSGA